MAEFSDNSRRPLLTIGVRLLSLWDNGNNTADIAAILHIEEAQVVRTLTPLLEQRRNARQAARRAALN